MYMQSTTALKASMVEFSNSVGAQLGVQYPYTVTAPLATSLAGTQFIRLFLDQVREPALFACVPSGNRLHALFHLVIHVKDLCAECLSAVVPAVNIEFRGPIHVFRSCGDISVTASPSFVPCSSVF